MLAQLILLVVIQIIFFWEFEYSVALKLLFNHLLKSDVVSELFFQFHQYPQTLPFVLGFCQHP
jgi:hypothetical protein